LSGEAQQKPFIKRLASADYVEGVWRNGKGKSWEIAQQPDKSGDRFFWRLALARISQSTAFSHYDNVDRFITLIDGPGFTLSVDGRESHNMDMRFTPHGFPGDAETSCGVHSGVSRVLNLFVARGRYDVRLDVLQEGQHRIGDKNGNCLVFVLDGQCAVDGLALACQDTAVIQGQSAGLMVPRGGIAYVAVLLPA
jgi:uncharacterized protein